MTQIPNTPGVYCLKAIDSKLIYIGSTSHLRIRKNIHLSHIKKNNTAKGCIAMIDAFHSGDFVVFEILESCENYLEREQYWLDFYRNQDTYRVVNQFDADRNNSSSTQEFKNKMSAIRKLKWLEPEYRRITLLKLEATRFTEQTLSKKILVINGSVVLTYSSAKRCAENLHLNKTSIAAAARGDYRNSFKYKDYIFIYVGVLYKLDELLETHQELRAISSQVWEVCKQYQEGSTTNE